MNRTLSAYANTLCQYASCKIVVCSLLFISYIYFMHQLSWMLQNLKRERNWCRMHACRTWPLPQLQLGVICEQCQCQLWCSRSAPGSVSRSFGSIRFKWFRGWAWSDNKSSRQAWQASLPLKEAWHKTMSLESPWACYIKLYMDIYIYIHIYIYTVLFVCFEDLKTLHCIITLQSFPLVLRV